jgi:hypothetical protein
LKKINIFILREYFGFSGSVAANGSYLLPDKPGLGPVGCDNSNVVGGEIQAAVVILHQFTHHQSLLTVAEQGDGCRSLEQCSESVTYWYGSGSSDPYL